MSKTFEPTSRVKYSASGNPEQIVKQSDFVEGKLFRAARNAVTGSQVSFGKRSVALLKAVK